MADSKQVSVRADADWPGGQLNYFEGSVLQALVKIWDPDRVLELGTHKGVSTEYLAEATDAPIVTVDKDDYEERTVEEDFEHVEFVHADALDYLAKDNLFDFAFLDDQHAWEDVEERLTLLPEGCLAISHDAIPKDMHELASHADFVIELPFDKRSGGFAVWKL